MARSVIISPDQGLSDRLLAALEQTGGIVNKRVHAVYPASGDLLRGLRGGAVEILFLSFDDLGKARDLVKMLETEMEHLLVVALHSHPSSEALRETMRLGLRESLWEPFESSAIREVLEHSAAYAERRTTHANEGELLCFFPAKPGVGATTVAMNTAAALAKKNPVLLTDFDISAGMTRFILRLSNKFSVTDAVDMAPDMDEALWRQMTTKQIGMDVLHAGNLNPNFKVDVGRLHDLLDFLRRTYKFVVADLSGSFERHSLEIMLESKTVFLVCTPETNSIYLAREKLAYLKSVDIASRVSVILNRTAKKALLSPAQVEEFLGVPVMQAFPNDYAGVNKALEAGHAVESASDLGKQFAQFAARLQAPAEKPAAAGTAKRQKAPSGVAAALRSFMPKKA